MQDLTPMQGLPGEFPCFRWNIHAGLAHQHHLPSNIPSSTHPYLTKGQKTPRMEPTFFRPSLLWLRPIDDGPHPLYGYVPYRGVAITYVILFGISTGEKPKGLELADWKPSLMRSIRQCCTLSKCIGGGIWLGGCSLPQGRLGF